MDTSVPRRFENNATLLFVITRVFIGVGTSRNSRVFFRPKNRSGIGTRRRGIPLSKTLKVGKEVPDTFGADLLYNRGYKFCFT